jgi:hypothetical protein
MHVEGLGLESTEAVGDRTEHLAHSREVIESFLHERGSDPRAARLLDLLLGPKKRTGSCLYCSPGYSPC